MASRLLLTIAAVLLLPGVPPSVRCNRNNHIIYFDFILSKNIAIDFKIKKELVSKEDSIDKQDSHFLC
jgi:hypothetical protein